MANVDWPRGLRPVRYLSGAPYSGARNRYYVPSTDTNAAVYVGGLVKLAGSADADGIATVTGNVSTGNQVVGVVVAVEPVTADSLVYRANSTARYVYVADDPNLLFAVQDDGAAALAATNVGMTADLTAFTSGSTTTGYSAIEISAATVTSSGDGTEDVLIVGLVSDPRNTFGVNADWLVRLNNHQFIDGAAGA